MSKKNSADPRGFVFSTDPDFRFEETYIPAQETLLPPQQKLRIKLDAKRRAGKAVTLVIGFIGITSDLDDLGKRVKNFCGTGGSVKNGEIIIQGDQRDKVMLWLIKNGFTSSKKV